MFIDLSVREHRPKPEFNGNIKTGSSFGRLSIQGSFRTGMIHFRALDKCQGKILRIQINHRLSKFPPFSDSPQANSLPRLLHVIHIKPYKNIFSFLPSFSLFLHRWSNQDSLSELSKFREILNAWDLIPFVWCTNQCSFHPCLSHFCLNSSIPVA